MEINECFITTAGEDWVRIENCNVHMNVKRRLQRTVIRGNEGDDLLDEGAESAIYTITGKMSMAKYKEILAIFRKEQPIFNDRLKTGKSRHYSLALTMIAQQVNTNSSCLKMQSKMKSCLDLVLIIFIYSVKMFTCDGLLCCWCCFHQLFLFSFFF